MSVIFGLTVEAEAVKPKIRGSNSSVVIYDEKSFPSSNKSFGESFGGWDDIEKALTHKYLRRIPKKNGKGYWYIYAETFQKPLAALKTFFGLQTKAISDTYDKNDIKKDFGADKKTFAAHLLEYLSNKFKWDAFFKKKENSDGYKAPRKSPPAGAGSGGGKKGVDKKGNQGDNKVGEYTIRRRKKMEQITLVLDKENYPMVIRQYGAEGATSAAINMCLGRKQEITEENLYSCLSTLETDLQEMFG